MVDTEEVVVDTEVEVVDTEVAGTSSHMEDTPGDMDSSHTEDMVEDMEEEEDTHSHVTRIAEQEAAEAAREMAMAATTGEETTTAVDEDVNASVITKGEENTGATVATMQGRNRHRSRTSLWSSRRSLLRNLSRSPLLLLIPRRTMRSRSRRQSPKKQLPLSQRQRNQ